MCDGEGSGRQVLNCAAAIDQEMIGTGEACSYMSAEQKPSLIGVYVTAATREKYKSRPGCALRPKRRTYMGANTVEKYAEDIGKWLDASGREKGSKQFAAIMREKLFEKYPGKYDVPIELHINSLISTMNATGFRESTEIGSFRSEGVTQRRRCGMHSRYQVGLRRLFTRKV